ncbi:MAG: Do family serine endopeptidase [Hyphomicrobiaceae bacterium]
MSDSKANPTAETESVTARGPTLSRFRSRMLAGIAVGAMIAGAAGIYQAEAASGPTLFAPGTEQAARVPASPVNVPGFSDLAAAVKPAVVSIRVKSDMGASQAFDGPNPFEGTPFEKFFRNFGDQNGEGPQLAPRGAQPHRMMQAQGSGFFVSPDGYIVTNNHVVNNAVEVNVVLDNGDILSAKVVGADKRSDLALLKVSGRDNFPYVKLARQTPKIGEWVVAMGNPFGLGGTVTAGIVSAQGRDIGSGPYDDYLQIDAPVNRGNSGGPTFNLKGEVVGVNTAIYSPSGGSVGIAFDIPASTVAAVIPQLQEHGSVTRGWLGVQIQTVTPEIADSLGLKKASGALIAEPQAGGPAAKAGLKSGDVVVRVGDTDIKDARDLARKIAALGPDKDVAVTVYRDGGEHTVNLTLGKLQDKAMQKADAGTGNDNVAPLGLVVAPAKDVDGAGNRGVAVVRVDPNGRGAELGFQPGDVIVKAGDKVVSAPRDLSAALASAKAAGRKSALVLVKHDQVDRYIAVPVA